MIRETAITFRQHSFLPARLSKLHDALFSGMCLFLFLVLGLQSSNAQINAPKSPEISGGAQGSFLLEEYMKEHPDWSPEQMEKVPYEGERDRGLLTDFDGINYDVTQFIPPDPHGAAGLNHVVNVVNVSIEWYTKAGVQQNSQTLQTFFGSPTSTFDPKVLYDQYEDRFIVVTLEQQGRDTDPTNDVSNIYVAVSDDGDPNGVWYFHTINAVTNIGGQNHWADYPGFAIDEEAVYITNNMFSHNGDAFGGVRLWIMDKGVAGGFYSGAAAAVTIHDPYTAVGSVATTTQPAHTFGAPPAGVGTYMLSHSGLTDGIDEFIQYVRVDNPLGATSFTQGFLNISDISPGGGLPDAPQMGTGVAIETNDPRALNAVWRNGELATCFTIVGTGADAGEATAYWVLMSDNGGGLPTLNDQGSVGGEDIAPGTSTFFPSVALNMNNDLAIGYAASAPTIFPGAYYTTRKVADPPGTVGPSQTLRAGTDYYVRTYGGARNRWGDYTGTVVDPSDDLCFWVYNEYAITRGNPTFPGPEDGRWGTAFGNFCAQALACDILLVSAPATDETCLGSGDGTITINATCGFCADIEYSIDGGTTWVLTNVFTGLTPGMYSVSARGTVATSCSVSIMLTINPGLLNPSIACPADVNFSMGSDPLVPVTPEALGLPAGYDLELRDKDGNVIAGNVLSCNYEGQEITYFLDHPCGNTCWGKVQVESKLIPDPTSTYQEVMCGTGDLDDIDIITAKAISASCYIDLTDFREVFHTNGDLCDGYETVRVIEAQAVIDGVKQVVLVHTDTIIEMPLDTSMILCPYGSDFNNPVEIWCDDGGTSPADIAAHWDDPDTEDHNEGIPYAYPYLDKGLWIVEGEDCELVDITIDTTILVLIEGFWVEIDAVYHDTIEVCTPTIEELPKYIGLDKGKTCNIDVKCQDMLFNSCTGPDTKIMRTWTILDWCNGSIKECMQWIKVVDDEAPEIEPIDDQFVSIAPWTCAAEYVLDPDIEDNCSDWTVDYYVSNGYVSGGVLRGLWIDESPVEVWVKVTDACGNYSEEHFYIYIHDDIPPVIVAEDQVNVSLTGDVHGDAADNGVAKVYVNAIDAGSHDAGCGDVYLCLLLKEELENPIYDHYGNYVYDDYGNQLYHAAQCAIDGTVTVEWPDGKGTVEVDYDYVICKDYVKFCCSDIGDNQVALVGHDHYDNYNHSWTTVTVEDKSTPVYDCAEDVYIDCGDYWNAYDVEPHVYNGLCSGSDLDYTYHENIDACGDGYVEIIWTLDGNVICINYIFIEDNSTFDPYNIRWPKHYDSGDEDGVRRECEDGYVVEYEDDIPMGDAFECEGDALQEPVWCDAECALVGSNYEDLEVDATDACRKIIRRWTVIDWCTWEPNYNSPGDDANDTDYDQFEAVDDEWLTRDGLNWVYADYRDDDGDVVCEECLHNSGASDDVYFRYTQVDPDGYYTFDQVIKVVDLTAPVIDAPDNVYVGVTDGNQTKLNPDYSDCHGKADVTATVSDLCGEVALDPSTISWYIHTEEYYTGDLIAGPKAVVGSEATMSTGYGYPGDVHVIVWTAKDGCGNEAYYHTYVYFEDVKKPTPVCLQDISTATMNTTGCVTIWAQDYDLGSFDNCSDVYVTFKDSSGNEVPSLTFCCEDIPNGVSRTIELEMWVVDESGNEDYCYVTLRIDDNSDACPDVDVGAANIAGVIMDRSNYTLESATVKLSTGSEAVTPIEGTYAFNDVTKLSSYVVSATKNDDHLNGVSTLDAVLLQQHILGLVPFNDPYKAIAGDVNNSGDITALDIVEMRKLILGIYNELPNNQSWRFVDAKETFIDNNNPFPFTEKLTIASLEGPMMDLDFVAVKIADVSGNSIANSLQVKGRSAGTLTLETADRAVAKGNEFTVEVKGTNFVDVSGYQFTMELNGIEFIGAESGAVELSGDNFGRIDASTVTTAWYNATGVSASNDVLFSLRFKANADVNLSEALSLSSRVTNAVAYTGTDYSERNVEMVFEGVNLVTEATFELGQNEPNPFNDRTTIGFVLPKSGKVTFSVFDVTGKLVVEKVGEYAKGANTISLTKDELGASSGVLYYQMKSGEYKASRKMILMN